MDHSSTLWGVPIDSLELWGFRLLWVGALAGVGGLVAAAISAYVLYVAGSVDLSKVRTELASAQTELETAKNNAKQIDANLLQEQRLTSQERWRLRHLERAVLSRSKFVDWDKLHEALSSSGLRPFNIAVVQRPAEASTFGRDLMFAMQNAGVLKRYFELPFSFAPMPTFSSGSYLIVANGDSQAEALGRLLWQFGIAGAAGGKWAGMPPEWGIPDNETTLLVLENGRWMAPMDGQDGEGLDERGRPLPPK
jgi:hypothetical protein